MSMSPLLGWGACARDKNTSARLCAKRQGGLCVRGGVFVGHYGIIMMTRDTSISGVICSHQILLASSPGHSQILTRICGESRFFSPQLQDKLWEWPGDDIPTNTHKYKNQTLTKTRWKVECIIERLSKSLK